MEGHQCITQHDCHIFIKLEGEYGNPTIGMPEEDEKLFQSISSAIAECTWCQARYLAFFASHL